MIGVEEPLLRETLLPRDLEIEVLKQFVKFDIEAKCALDTIKDLFALPMADKDIVEKLEKSRARGVKKLLKKFQAMMEKYIA